MILLFPCPPIIDIEPVHNPNSGFKLNTFANVAPTISCEITKSIAIPKNIATFIPPFFNILKLAVKPTLASNVVINKFCNVVSNIIVANIS